MQIFTEAVALFDTLIFPPLSLLKLPYEAAAEESIVGSCSLKVFGSSKEKEKEISLLGANFNKNKKTLRTGSIHP